MKLERAALVSEIVSSIAIVITLIVLVIETRENTDAIRASTRESLSERAERIALNLATNPSLSAVVASETAFRNLPPFGESTRAESVQLRAYIALYLRNTEEAYLQMLDGRLEESYFDDRLRNLLLYIREDAGAEIYQLQRTAGTFAQEFIDTVDEALLASDAQ